MNARFIVMVCMFSVMVFGSARAQDEPLIAQRLIPEVLSEYPHDAEAYTQGLLLYDSYFYESTGLNGQSSLRKVEPETGEVLQRVDVDSAYFAEGLTLVDDRLIQLTWRSGIAMVYDRETFEVVDEFTYQGEGWGLCYDGEQLYMSDGSTFLFIRDPETFEATGFLRVTLDGEPIDQINELECVDEWVYANVWKVDSILQIDKETGEVVALIDATNLLPPDEKADMLAANSGAVLNGIAYDPENEVFFITGKLWDTLFEVRFVEPDAD